MQDLHAAAPAEVYISALDLEIVIACAGDEFLPRTVPEADDACCRPAGDLSSAQTKIDLDFFRRPRNMRLKYEPLGRAAGLDGAA
jgi:hypothetical protein